MTDLKKRMREIRRELLQASRRFVDAGQDKSVPPRRALLELQQHLDHLRQAIWDARKLCDPHLVPFPHDPVSAATSTLAERILRVVDARKKTA
jgi:hypothetical protein